MKEFSERFRAAIERSRLLKKKPWLNPKVKIEGTRPPEDQMASWRMAIQRNIGVKVDPSYEKNGQMRLFARGPAGMKRFLIELGYKRASKDVIHSIAERLNRIANSRPETKIPGDAVRFGGRSKKDAYGNILYRPRVVVDDAGNNFIIVHRGVSRGGKNALKGEYGGKLWGFDGKAGDKAAMGLPTSANKGIANSFSNWPNKHYPGAKGSTGIKAGRGNRRVAKIKPSVGTYLIPEKEIDNLWVRPYSDEWGEELEIRHERMGDFLKKIRAKRGGAKIGPQPPKTVTMGEMISGRLRELAVLSSGLVELSMVTAAQIAKVGNPKDRIAFVKSLRRHLEKISQDRRAVRSAMGARPSPVEITSKKTAEVLTKDAYMQRAAKRNPDIFPDGDTWPEIPYRDPDFAPKMRRLNRIRRIAERAAKNRRYQKLTGNEQGYVKKNMPKLVQVNGEPSILTYRGIEMQPKQLNQSIAGTLNDSDVLAEAKRRLQRPRNAWESPAVRTSTRHARRAGGGISSQPGDPNGTAMSMSTSPRVAEDFAKGGPVGVYSVKVRDLLKEAREGKLSGRGDSKLALVNSGYKTEREITQANGGNLVAVRVNDRSSKRRVR